MSMEYKRLIQLDNQYPNLRNYTNNGIDTNVLLKGIYYTGDVTNQVQFNLEDLSKVTYVNDTKFRFILSILTNASDKNPKLYTSKVFYDDLKSSYNETNPYLPLAAFNKSFLISITYYDLLRLFESYKSLEETDLVFLHKNVFINEKSEIDYDALCSYIDWAVTAPNSLDFDSAGVKPAETLGFWSTLTIDPATGKAVNKKQAEENKKKANKEAQIKLLNEELAKIVKDIAEYEAAINRNDYDNIGLSRSKVTVAGTEYTSGQHLLNRAKQNNDIKTALKTKLNELLAKKAQLEKSISDAIGTQPNTGVEQGTAGNITELSAGDLEKIKQIDTEIEKLKKDEKKLVNRILGKVPEIKQKIQKLEKEKSDIKASSKKASVSNTGTITETKPTITETKIAIKKSNGETPYFN